MRLKKLELLAVWSFFSYIKELAAKIQLHANSSTLEM